MAGRAAMAANGERAQGAVDSALRTLRELIINGELKPGDQIRQDEMAVTLGVSRVPLREALRALASEGLLIHRLNQGYFVAELSVEEFGQIVALLEFLETELIRTVRWPTPEEVAELRALNARIGAATSRADVTYSNEANRDFHFAIFRLSPLTVFVAEAERYWALGEPFRILHVATADSEEITDQHEQLIDALAAGDRALCIRLMNDHRRATRVAAVAALTERNRAS